jgi:hypothetical protein
MQNNSRIWAWFGLGVILAVAAYFRWTGLVWDNGYLFHPDERQIALIVSGLKLPASVLDFFSSDSSLNPKFFAYGSLPIYLLRAVIPFAPPTNIVGPWSDDQLARWVLLGRWLSGLFDLGTIVLTYALGRRAYSARIGLFAAACVALTVLHIQLAHFYAVDTLLTFFTLATMYAALRVAETQNARASKRWLIGCGTAFGLALATKVTAAPLLIPMLYACARATNAPTLKFSRAQFLEMGRALRRPFLQIVGIGLLVFVLTQPYALLDWYTFGRDVFRETLVARGWLDYPYTRQFLGTTPVWYQVSQSAVWGMGLPLGIFAWGGGALFVWQWRKSRAWRDTFLLSFALFYFVTIAFQHAKYLRYVLPMLPVLYIIAAVAWARVLQRQRAWAYGLGFVVLGAALLYALGFTQLYAREHPWLVASRWMYQNIPAGKTLTVEEWDDALPVQIQMDEAKHFGSEYTQIVLRMYDDDSDTKRAALAHALAQADAVVLASPRLYGSITRNPARYPMTTRYYEKLFSGELGFEAVMTARNDIHVFGISICDDPFAGLPLDTSRVNALLPDACDWNWGFADESFFVYDHSQPIVFEKTRALSVEEMEQLLQSPR